MDTEFTPEQVARDMQADAEQMIVLRRCLASSTTCGTCKTLCPKREPECEA